MIRQTAVKFSFSLSIAMLASAAQAEAAPSSDRICDEIKGTPGGAYGLCVAIMEVPADDCTPTFDPDGFLVEESLDGCRPSSRKLVSKFLERTAGTDVRLPGAVYQEPPLMCPCQELAEPMDFVYQDTYGGGYALTASNFGYFILRNGATGMEPNCTVNDRQGGYIPALPLNPEEYTACYNFWASYSLPSRPRKE